MFGSNCRIICGASLSRFTEHFGPCSSLPISACRRAIYAVYTGRRDDCRGAGRAYSKNCHVRRPDLLLTRNIDGGPFGCVASQSQKAGINLRKGAFNQQQQQQSGGRGVFWGSFEDRNRIESLCLWRVGPLHLQVQTRSSAAAPGGCVAKMLTVEEVYQNTVLPSQIINVSTIDSMLGRPVYTKLNGLSSDVEVDPAVNVPIDGEQKIWSSSANISRLQSDSVTQLKRTPRQKPLSRAEHRRRRTTSDPSLFVCGGGLHRQSSLREFGNDVHHAATETYLITRLAFTLLRYLGVGTRWIGKLIRLGLYALFLMPGFIQVGFFYYFSKCVHRSIVYGNQPRNRLDLYMPPESDKPKSVVIFITGGAWIIGYKAWGSLLAQQLVDRDIIVACIDYRNFPQGSISDMVSDVCTGIGFVCENAACYGGDPNKLYLAGQSAGAHLAACALVMQAKEEATQDPTKLSWRSSQLRAYMAISGGYNLIKLVEHFHKRGLYKSIFYRTCFHVTTPELYQREPWASLDIVASVMEGEASLPLYSPEYMVMSPSFKESVPLLPPITLFHGTADYSIRHDASVAFGVALTLVGAKSKTVLYRDKTHTDLFLQDPMRGGKDDLLADILAIVHEDDEEARAEDAVAMERRRLVPEILLQLARLVSPF